MKGDQIGTLAAHPSLEKLSLSTWTRFTSPVAASPHSGARWIRGWLARTCLYGQACSTCLRRIMLPTQSGELLSSPHCSEARMRRPTRPFTVEIKSSRRPVSIRKPVPTLVDRPRTEPLPRDLLLGDPWTTVQDRRPAQEAALSDAHSVFSRWAISAPGPVQTAAPLRVGPRRLEHEAIGPEQSRRAERRAEARQARILPDLLTLSRAGEPPSPEAEKRSAPRRKPQSSKMQERVEPQPEKAPGLDHVALRDAGQEHSEPAEMEAPALSDPLEMAAAEQGAMPPSPSSEVMTSAEGGSPRPGRRSREVCPGWRYRAACRKAKRRGEPLPLRVGAKWKRR
jgi:hypothetical protein